MEWVLLDNQSTMDVFINRRLLKNIRRIDQYMYIHCTAGVTTTNLFGELPGYGTVWFHPDGIANILSLSRVKTKYQITFDSDKNNEFIVHKPDGSTRNFKESSRGLYYHDTSTVVIGVAEARTVLITTVADYASNYPPVNSQDMAQYGFTQMVLPISFPCPGSRQNIRLLLIATRTTSSLYINQMAQQEISRNLAVVCTIMTLQLWS